MSEKLTIREISDVGETNSEDPEQMRLNGAIVLEAFNSAEAAIEEADEDAPWNAFQVEEDEDKRTGRVEVPTDLLEELDVAA